MYFLFWFRIGAQRFKNKSKPVQASVGNDQVKQPPKRETSRLYLVGQSKFLLKKLHSGKYSNHQEGILTIQGCVVFFKWKFEKLQNWSYLLQS